METTKRDERPTACKPEHLKYLDTLRESSVTNMFGARSWLMFTFPELSAVQAKAILAYWMRTFGQTDR